ncbi:MAG: hypothetical protein GF409_02545 [Candidatus Omnitrophica bacterium]|nr:hypothetical protein [Candidatus Omnitrophota bacterium]
MKKIWIYVLVGLLAVVLALSATKDNILKFSLERGVTGVTGLKLSISDFKVGLIKTMIDIRGLRLYNPRGFKDRIMLDMPKIYVDYDLLAFFKGRVHLSQVNIELREFIVEKNSRGELNLDSLKMAQDKGEQKKAPESKEDIQLQIDNLRLKVGKVIYKDYSKQEQPQVQEFDVNIDETYNDITDLESVISLIMVKALAKTTVSRLANFELNKLTDNITDKLLSSSKLFSPEKAGKIGGTLKKLEGSLFGGDE